MPRVTVIDCGVGNLFSITCALRRTGLDADISSGSHGLKAVDAVLLPGVGNFKAGSRNLRVLKPDIMELVEAGAALFGVCLGMQLLFEGSEESSGEGLGLLSGRVLRLPANVKTPHMGWNTVTVRRSHELLDGVGERDYFYFVHSYYANPVDEDAVVAETDYGLAFASIIAKRNICGTQFHPEKSGKPGERVLRNFAGILRK